MTEKYEKGDGGEPTREPKNYLDPLRIKCGQIERHPTDQKLWDSLPSVEDPYHPRWLSEREITALHEALQDGFGRGFAGLSEGAPLPAEVNSGLLHHEDYWDPNDRGPLTVDELGNPKNPASQYIATEATLADEFPLGFSARRVQVYFCRQLQRFQHHAPATAIKPYEKPWYESHALRLLDQLDYPDLEILKHPGYARMWLTGCAGLLGQLVEQYYWRFQYERPAVTGLGARSGASASGKNRALRHEQEHLKWQAKAREIRSRHPHLKCHAVADAVKKQLKLKLSAKHIARYLRGLFKK